MIRAHYATLYNARSRRRPSRSDYVLFLGVPVVLAFAAGLLDITLSNSDGMLAGAGALAGLLFALLILLLQMSTEVVADAEDPDQAKHRRLNRRVLNLRELSANVSYSALVAVLLVVLLACGNFTVEFRGSALGSYAWVHRTYGATVIMLVAHMIVTLLMVMKRTFNITQGELDKASAALGQGGFATAISEVPRQSN